MDICSIVHCECYLLLFVIGSVTMYTGQFWNIPVNISPYTGSSRDGSVIAGGYIINITTSGKDRSYTGLLHDITWDSKAGPCLYAGNRQSGSIYEIIDPNDGVIESIYTEYRVESAFSEASYTFSLFDEARCV